MSGYRLSSQHPEDLANGRTVAPGDHVPASAVDKDDPHDKRLLDEGVLIEVPTQKKKES